MPLDPQAKEALDKISVFDKAFVATADRNLAPEKLQREYYKNLFALFETGSKEPVACVEDTQIDGPIGKIELRIFTPQKLPRPSPAFVYIHGGGWVAGDLDTYDSFCRFMTNATKFKVFSVGYHLAPEYRFPAAVEEAHFVTKWVADNATALGVDAERIAIGGDSSGGNLAAAVGLMARDRRAPPLLYQVLIYPGLDHSFDTKSMQENANGYLLTKDDIISFWKQYLKDEKDGSNPYASPLRATDLRGLPPTLVITAEFDPLRDEGEAYANRLKLQGVPVRLSRYNGMIHGFVLMASMIDLGKAAAREVASALVSASNL